jgi:molybdopterin-guanine dinucleotide biosynthesis protein A
MAEPLTNQTQISLSAIVLAGGQSSRMGQDKALIQVGTMPLLQQVCKVAQHCADAVYVVTPWLARYQDLLATSNHPSEQNIIQFVQEAPLPGETSPHGPLVGFSQGLAQVKTDWVLLLACDLPQLQVEVLQAWVEELPKVESGIDILLARNPHGWWEPLCGFYRHRCLATLEQFIQQGGRSFQAWLAQQSVQELALANPRMLFNCNTPEDLRRVALEFQDKGN